MYKLAAGGLKSFQAAKYIRSNRHKPKYIYQLYRMASHMNENYKAFVIKLISRAMQYRNLVILAKSLSLITPFLIQEGFKKCSKDYLKQIFGESNGLCTPMHLPSGKLLESRHSSLGDTLYNWTEWYDLFVLQTNFLCLQRVHEEVLKYAEHQWPRGIISHGRIH